MGIKAEDFKVGQIWISRGQRSRIHIDKIEKYTEDKVYGRYSTLSNVGPYTEWVPHWEHPVIAELADDGVWRTDGGTEYGNIIYSPEG
jgi:hypothetical protein